MSNPTTEYKGSIEHPLYSLDGLQDGVWAAMPDPDIANLGRERDTGVMWFCGDYAESICTSSTYLTGYSVAADARTDKPPETAESAATRSAVRAQKNVRRIVNANHFRYLWTLTFCPANSPHAATYSNPVCLLTQSHYRSVRDLWKRFLRLLRKDYPDISWLLVLELHDSEKTTDCKRGTYHLHFVVSQFMEWETVRVLWGHGNVRFDDFQKGKPERKEKVRNPGAYVSKYIGKAFSPENYHLKRYTCSRNVKRPLKVGYAEGLKMLEGLDHTPVYSRERVFYNSDTLQGLTHCYGVTQTTYHLKGVQP